MHASWLITKGRTDMDSSHPLTRGRPRPPRCAFHWLAALILSFLCSSAGAQTSPCSYPTDTRLSELPIPAVSPAELPPYRVAVTEPTFGTKLTRIGDNVALPNPGCSRTDCSDPNEPGNCACRIHRRHNYSRLQPWNSDGTLLILDNRFVLDGRSYERIGEYSQASSEMYWSEQLASKLWEFDPNYASPAAQRQPVLRARSFSRNAQTGALTVGGSPVLTLPAGAYDLSTMGAGEGRLSSNDGWVALTVRPTNTQDLQILLYDLTECTSAGCGQPYASPRLPRAWVDSTDPAKGPKSYVDWASVSPSGNYVVVAMRADYQSEQGDAGAGPYHGVFVMERAADGARQLVWARQLADMSGHSDLCYESDASDASEVMVQVRDLPGELVSYRLRDGDQKVILDRRFQFGGHVSCTNYRRRGWAYVSAVPGLMEVFAVKLDGSQVVERFAHHHSLDTPYVNQPHAAADPDGRRVIFASNWGAPSQDPATVPVYSYVAEPAGERVICLLPNDKAPLEARMSAGTAQLRFYNATWQAMTLKTPRGVEIPATDLFYYATHSTEVPGDYWTRPETWAQRFSFESLPTTDAGSTLIITGEREGVTKKVSATIYPDEPVVYVVNQLYATRPLHDLRDNPLMYVANDPAQSVYASEISLDGQNPGASSARGSSYAFLRLPNLDSSLGLLMAPANQQKSKLPSPLFYHRYPGAGSDLGVFGTDGHTLQPGELIELRYAIYWNDGHQGARIQALAQQLQGGQLNGRFRTRPPIELLPTPSSPSELRIYPAAGHLRFYNAEWQAMTLRTRQGVEIAATDLFFYATQADGLTGSYWTQEGTWYQRFSFTRLPDAGGASTVRIVAQREGVTKTVYATVYPGDPLIYVVNRLSANRTLHHVYDAAVTYLANGPGSSMYAPQVVLDGTPVSGSSARGSASSLIRLPIKDATLGILFAPPAQQTTKIPGPLFYMWTEAGGSDMRLIGIDGQTLNLGEVVELRYALYWGDGDKSAELQELSARMQGGELNTRFRAE